MKIRFFLSIHAILIAVSPVLYFGVFLNPALAGPNWVPYEKIPYLPKVSPYELQKQVWCDLNRLHSIEDLRRYADFREINLFMFSKSATDFIHRSRIEILRQLQGGSAAAELGWEFLPRIEPKLQFAVIGKSGEVLSAQKLESLRKELEQFFPGKNISVTGLKIEPSGHFLSATPEFIPGSLSVQPRSESHFQYDSFGTTYIDIFGKLPIGDLTHDSNPFPASVVAMASNELKFSVFWPQLAMQFEAGTEHPFLPLLRLVGQRLRYGLGVDLRLLMRMRLVFDSIDAADLDEVAQSLIDSEGRMAFLDALDFEDAMNTFEFLQVREKLFRPQDARRATSFSHYLFREPLRSFPHPKQYEIDHLSLHHGLKASDLGLEVCTHRTTQFAHQLICSHPAGKLNAILSRPYTLNEAAYQGPGFYTLPLHYKGKDFGECGLTIQVSPEAIQNRHFILTSGNFFHGRFCRLISSDPDFVRLEKRLQHPLYRPVVLGPSVTGTIYTKPKFSKAKWLLVNLLKKL